MELSCASEHELEIGKSDYIHSEKETIEELLHPKSKRKIEDSSPHVSPGVASVLSYRPKRGELVSDPVILNTYIGFVMWGRYRHLRVGRR